MGGAGALIHLQFCRASTYVAMHMSAYGGYITNTIIERGKRMNDFVRPGIDDRPDYDKALTDE